MRQIFNKTISIFQHPQFLKSASCFVLLMLLMIPHLHAQLSDPGAGNPGANGEPDAAPIDGGLSLLVAAGVGYGAKKMKERKAKNKM